MQTPEEFAREMECDRMGDQCVAHGLPWPCNDSAVRYVAALIRARDAEVAEQARAEALTGFEWEHRTDLPGRRGINPVRRLVGPWTPTEGDDQP